jgi:hypothetical protein
MGAAGRQLLGPVLCMVLALFHGTTVRTNYTTGQLYGSHGSPLSQSPGLGSRVRCYGLQLRRRCCSQ